MSGGLITDCIEDIFVRKNIENLLGPDNRGFKLGSLKASQVIGSKECWLYDRTLSLIFPCHYNHALLASSLYCLHTGIQWHGCEQADLFIDNDMGFWQSSVGAHHQVGVSKTFKLTAFEHHFFKRFHMVVV